MIRYYILIALSILGSIGDEAIAQTNKFTAGYPKPSVGVKSAIDFQGTATPPAGFAIKSVQIQIWEDNSILGLLFIGFNAGGQWPIDDMGKQIVGSLPTAKANTSYNFVVIAEFTKNGAANIKAATKGAVPKSSK
jgi:hypothetical protein